MRATKARILELDGQASVAGNKDALLDCVAKCERKSVCRNSMLEDNEDPFDNDEVDPVLHDILKASKLKPLGDEAKKYCREGHLLKRPFLEQFYKHSQDGITCGYKAVAVHETPVGKCTNETFLFLFLSSRILCVHKLCVRRINNTLHRCRLD